MRNRYIKLLCIFLLFILASSYLLHIQAATATSTTSNNNNKKPSPSSSNKPAAQPTAASSSNNNNKPSTSSTSHPSSGSSQSTKPSSSSSTSQSTKPSANSNQNAKPTTSSTTNNNKNTNTKTNSNDNQSKTYSSYDKSNANKNNNFGSNNLAQPNSRSRSPMAAASHHPAYTPDANSNTNHKPNTIDKPYEGTNKSPHTGKNQQQTLIEVAEKLAAKILKKEKLTSADAEGIDLDADGQADVAVVANVEQEPDGTLKIELQSPSGQAIQTDSLQGILKTAAQKLMNAFGTRAQFGSIINKHNAADNHESDFSAAELQDAFNQAVKTHNSKQSINNNNNNNEEDAKSLETHNIRKTAQELFDRGQSYLNGTEPLNVLKAIELYTEAAKLNHSEAAAELGELYLFGNDEIPSDFYKAELYFNQSAKLGNPSAQHYLAFLYSTGLSPTVGRNQQLSLLYDQFAAFGGFEEAHLSLGYRYYQGLNVPKSCHNAVHYYHTVAQRVAEGLVDDPYNIPDIDKARLIDERARHAELQDDEDVLHYYSASAAAGDVNANLALGNFAQHGLRGMQQNHELAAQYYQRAAEAGDSTAMAQLAQLHVQGVGVPQDNETAFELFTEAAKRGNPAAANGLGVLYLHGIGCKQDNKQALQWFRRSADGGNAEGMFNLGVMLYQGKGVEQQLSVALQYFTMAALQGHTRAMFNVGSFHLSGLGTAKSCTQALSMFKSVSEKGDYFTRLTDGHKSFLKGDYNYAFLQYALGAFHGSEVAQSNAAWLLNEGLVTLPGYFNYKLKDNSLSEEEHNHKNQRELRQLAYYYLQLSTQQGSVDNLRIMGDYHYYGYLDENNAPDYKTAASLYLQASDRRNAQASFNLGYLHNYGIGVPKDYHLAKRYFDLALELDPNAYMPVKLALYNLQFQQWWEQFYDKWFATQDNNNNNNNKPTTTQTTTASKPTTSSKPSSSSSSTTHSTSNSGKKIPGIATKTAEVESDSYWDFETIENIVLTILCAALAIVVYIRSQRL